MSNETCVVSIADIYGEEWWQRNKEELGREWEWSFGVTRPGDTVMNIAKQPVPSNQYQTCIILHRRKPKPPTLRDVYGTDEVTIPDGWEWTGEWRVPVVNKDWGLSDGGCMAMRWPAFGPATTPRLILRERPKKVWFKAEEKMRIGTVDDWMWNGNTWTRLGISTYALYLCATRHEEIDQTVQVVTQADVDGVVNHA